MAGLSVLSLVASLVVGQLNYGVRSRDMQSNYKDIQFVSQDAEYYKVHDPSRSNYERVHGVYAETTSSASAKLLILRIPPEGLPRLNPPGGRGAYVPARILPVMACAIGPACLRT